MVFFSCGLCGEQIKKPKVEKHLGRCRSNELTCIGIFVLSNYMYMQKLYGGCCVSAWLCVFVCVCASDMHEVVLS